MRPALLTLLLAALPLLFAGYLHATSQPSITAHAQAIPTTGPTPASFIPPGYRVLPEGRATGDLNGDGRADVVLALGLAAEDTARAGDTLPPRWLLVLFRTAAGGFRLATQARKALLCKDCGGMYGDPFEGLKIERGILSIYHYGGSSWRWTLTAKFRYQQDDFYQIGETYNFTQVSADECPRLAGGYRPGDQYHDVNLLTGAYESIKVSQGCKLLENKRGRQPVQPLRPLAAYEPQP